MTNSAIVMARLRAFMSPNPGSPMKYQPRHQCHNTILPMTNSAIVMARLRAFMSPNPGSPMKHQPRHQCHNTICRMKLHAKHGANSSICCAFIIQANFLSTSRPLVWAGPLGGTPTMRARRLRCKLQCTVPVHPCRAAWLLPVPLVQDDVLTNNASLFLHVLWSRL